jgi:collagen type III alpha
MGRYLPFFGAWLAIAFFCCGGFAGPIYHSVPRASMALGAEPIERSFPDSELDASAQLSEQTSESKENSQGNASIQSASFAQGALHIPGVKPNRSIMGKSFKPGTFGEIRDTGFIPSFGYGPTFSARSGGASADDSAGGGSGGGGGGSDGSLSNFGQAGSFTQVASITQTGGPTSSTGGPGSSSNSGGSTSNSGSNQTSGQSNGSTSPGSSGGNTPASNNPPGNNNGGLVGQGGPGGSTGSGNNDPDPIGPSTGPTSNPPGSSPIVPAVAAVPEPPTVALCLIGFGGILCLAAYRRRGGR